MKKNILTRLLSFVENIAADLNEKKHESPQKKPQIKNSFAKKDSGFVGEEARQQSMNSSQGKSDFSGSSYNGPGNVDHEKQHSNKTQRNF